jgi:hypothetical protein
MPLSAPPWFGQREGLRTWFMNLSLPACHILLIKATAPEALVSDCRNFSVTRYISKRSISEFKNAKEWSAAPHGQSEVKSR